jgi:hypothetical protein
MSEPTPRPETQPLSGETTSQRRSTGAPVPYLARLLFPCLSPEFFAHMSNAQREVLLALRSLLDARIAALEEASSGNRQRKAQRISIE